MGVATLTAFQIAPPPFAELPLKLLLSSVAAPPLFERPPPLSAELPLKVLLLATHKGGKLTVTEVAADLNLSLPAAEKVLAAMDDGFRVRCEVSKDGVLYYEFPEVLHRKQLDSGLSD